MTAALSLSIVVLSLIGAAIAIAHSRWMEMALFVYLAVVSLLVFLNYEPESGQSEEGG